MLRMFHAHPLELSRLENAIYEDGALNDLEDQFVVVQFPPVLLGFGGQFENHGERPTI